MKPEDITNEILDEAFLASIDFQLKHHGWHGAGTKTDHLAQYLWKKYRVQIWKERKAVAAKMQAWWKSKSMNDRFQRNVCGYWVTLGAPMMRTYCGLEFSHGIVLFPLCMMTIVAKA